VLAVLALSLSSPPPADTLRLEVGSPEVDGRIFPVHRARNRVYLGDAAAPVTEWTNELTLGDSAGVPVMRWVTRGEQGTPDGGRATWELLQTYNARTLAPMAYSRSSSTGAYTRLSIDGTRVRGVRRQAAGAEEERIDQVLERPGFFAGASDLVPMAVGLREGVVMTAPVWSPGVTSPEVRVFSVLGRETVEVEGSPVTAWKVEERVEATGRHVANWWLTEDSPYMVAAEVFLPDGRVQRMTGVALDGR
jgi:hypothetical protein